MSEAVFLEDKKKYVDECAFVYTTILKASLLNGRCSGFLKVLDFILAAPHDENRFSVNPERVNSILVKA